MTEEQKKEAIRLLNIKSSGPTFTTPADYEAWGKPSYSSGLDLFGKSHESAVNNIKASADDISSTNLQKLFSKIDNNK